MNRRKFLGLTAGAVAIGATRPWRLPFASAGTIRSGLPATGAGAPFDHVVVLMQENRSFDHLLGWLPGANGRQAGLTYVDTTGARYPTYELSPDFQGCDYGDPDHSFPGGLKQFNGGRIDGFLQTAAPGDTFPIGYYGANSRPVLGALARNYTVCDNYFAAVLGQTFPNRIYQQAARTDRAGNTFETSTLLTIWDRLAAAGLQTREYFHDLPTLGLWGVKYETIMRPFAQFSTDVANGDLANYTLIDPAALGEGQGVSNDDHPHGDIRAGDELISTIYHALRAGPKWDRTVFIINYDEWGGFYDHVVPPRAAADDTAIPGSTIDFHQRGFRVPCVVMSPFAPAGVASNGPFDHTSILKMIEWRWNLQPLAARDAAASNLAEVLDFTTKRTDNPNIPVLTNQPRIACGPTSTKATKPAAIQPGSGGGAGAGAGGAASVAANGTRGHGTTPQTGTGLPILKVGGGVLLGAWGLYHLKRTGESGPLPVADLPQDGETT